MLRVTPHPQPLSPQRGEGRIFGRAVAPLAPLRESKEIVSTKRALYAWMASANCNISHCWQKTEPAINGCVVQMLAALAALAVFAQSFAGWKSSTREPILAAKRIFCSVDSSSV